MYLQGQVSGSLVFLGCTKDLLSLTWGQLTCLCTCVSPEHAQSGAQYQICISSIRPALSHHPCIQISAAEKQHHYDLICKEFIVLYIYMSLFYKCQIQPQSFMMMSSPEVQ